MHLPLLDSTRHLVDAEFLKLIKPTAYLLNAARGAIVDLDALAEALADGTIAGAGIDVFEPERLRADHPLLQQDLLLATPHTAFYSEESMRDLARHAAENVAAVLRGEQPAATVNRDALDAVAARVLSARLDAERRAHRAGDLRRASPAHAPGPGVRRAVPAPGT